MKLPAPAVSSNPQEHKQENQTADTPAPLETPSVVSQRWFIVLLTRSTLVGNHVGHVFAQQM
jgi:hypothetical protein